MMKKIALVLTIIAFGVLFVAMPTSLPSHKHFTYMRCMEVTDLNYDTDTVTCVDAVGFEWQFEGCEDYEKNDIVCVLMDDAGTPDRITDDIMLKINYSGYQKKSLTN